MNKINATASGRVEGDNVVTETTGLQDVITTGEGKGQEMDVGEGLEKVKATYSAEDTSLSIKAEDYVKMKIPNYENLLGSSLPIFENLFLKN